MRPLECVLRSAVARTGNIRHSSTRRERCTPWTACTKKKLEPTNHHEQQDTTLVAREDVGICRMSALMKILTDVLDFMSHNFSTRAQTYRQYTPSFCTNHQIDLVLKGHDTEVVATCDIAFTRYLYFTLGSYYPRRSKASRRLSRIAT